jgi:hypothetical protein
VIKVRTIEDRRRDAMAVVLTNYPRYGKATPSVRRLAHAAMHFQAVKHGVAAEELVGFLAMLGLDGMPCDVCEEWSLAGTVGGSPA